MPPGKVDTLYAASRACLRALRRLSPRARPGNASSLPNRSLETDRPPGTFSKRAYVGRPTHPPRPVFLHELSPEQRRALLVLARQVIDADRRLSIQEVERLDELYVESGLGPEMATAPGAVGDLNILFPTTRSRVVVILDLLLIGYADDELAPSEFAAIRDLAAQMEMDAGVWETALEWAQRHHALMLEATALGREAAVSDFD